MNVGFVGIVVDHPELKMRNCILKNATTKKLEELSLHNLFCLDGILDYLIEKDISLFRISSGAVPFASHPACKFNWENEMSDMFEKVGQKAIRNNIRLSMHPGQYTTLSTKDKLLLKRSVNEIDYHCSYLDCLHMPTNCKVILHIGGIYDNKEETMKRFIENYENLPEKIKKRLVIENDDKCYTASDVLEISAKTGCPVVFDYLHFLLNHNEDEVDAKKILMLCRKTWKKQDGVQKIHYSQQAENKRLGSHSETIDPEKFLEFSKILPKEIDIMFEVKDKNLSVIKWKEFKKSICD